MIAGILGLSFGELKDREEARARARFRLRASVFAAMLLLALLALGGGVLWLWTAEGSEKNVAEWIRVAATKVGDAVQNADRIGIQRKFTEHALSVAEDALDKAYRSTIDSPWLPWRKRAALAPIQAARAESKMIHADHYGVIGEYDRQLEKANEALSIPAWCRPRGS